MHGRLGNQFFQYAFAKVLQNNRNDNLAICFEKVKKNNNGWDNDLIHFQIDDYEITPRLMNVIFAMSFKQKCAIVYYNFKCSLIKDPKKLMAFQEKSQKWLNELGLYWIRNGEFTPIDSKCKNIFVCGHFENYKHYENMHDQFRRLFSSKKDLRESNLALYDQICSSQSVCVSIRRGDYLSNNNKSVYFVCDKGYFDKAIEEIRKLIPNSKIFLFSDDTKWVRDNFKGDDIYYETDDNPIWEKVILMTACKHFIISNSTFSWWMQYLSCNDNKIVVSPSRWKNNSDYKGLISPKFITIDI